MSSEPRPLPPRALPPISLDNGDDSSTRTPRKAGRKPGTRTGQAKQRRSPRNETDAGSLHPSASGVEAEETNVSAASVGSGETKPRRKRRRRQPQATEDPSEAATNVHNISSLLTNGGLVDDVVSVDRIDDAVVMTNLPGVAAGSGGSAPTDKIYVQTTNGFAAHNQDWLDKRNEVNTGESGVLYGVERVKPSDIAKQTEKAFLFIALILHGALAGITIWQVVVGYSMFNISLQNFLTQYQFLSMPTQSVYYIVLILCTISALDRYDFAAKDNHIFQSLAKFDLAAVGAVIYFITLLLSVGLAGVDAWIMSGVGITSTPDSAVTTSPNATTLSPELSGDNVDASSTINAWLIICVFRAVLATLGWFTIAVDPSRSDMTWEE